MPRPTCQLNLTLDVPTAEYVEEIAFAAHKRPSGVGRDLLLERLELARAGWSVDDRETLSLIKRLLEASSQKRGKIEKILG
ncbi:MAG: hypothetical protein KC964_31080 [Candidatus Omnitrophica bacterium]|nr:hypothetical protein [Candidatus Omnitrophota bacterium]